MAVLDRAGILVKFPGFVTGQAPQDVVCFYDDFLGASWSSSPDAAVWYNSLVVAAGTIACKDAGDPATQAYYAGGILSITTVASADDGDTFQVNGEQFHIEENSGLPLYFEARVAVGDVSNTDMCVGLSYTDAEILTTGPNDAVLFELESGTWKFTTAKDSTEKNTNTAITEADNQFIRVAFYFDGRDTITAYVDGDDDGEFELFATRTVSTTADYVPENEMMTPTISVITGTTGSAEEGMVDYVLCVQERYRAPSTGY